MKPTALYTSNSDQLDFNCFLYLVVRKKKEEPSWFNRHTFKLYISTFYNYDYLEEKLQRTLLRIQDIQNLMTNE